MAQPHGHPPRHVLDARPAAAPAAAGPQTAAPARAAPAGGAQRSGARRRRASAVSLAAFLGLSGFLMVEPHAAAGGHVVGHAPRTIAGAPVLRRAASDGAAAIAADTVTRVG